MELITGMWPFKQWDGPVSWNFCSSTLLSFYKLIAISSWVNGSCGHNEIGIDHLEAGAHQLVLWGISVESTAVTPPPHPFHGDPIFSKIFWTQHTPFRAALSSPGPQEYSPIKVSYVAYKPRILSLWRMDSTQILLHKPFPWQVPLWKAKSILASESIPGSTTSLIWLMN